MRKIRKVEPGGGDLSGGLRQGTGIRRVLSPAAPGVLDDQAGILAAELAENQPCPVCGSLHHPSPAMKTDDAPTRETVEQSQKRWEESKTAMDEAGRKAAALRGTRDSSFSIWKKRPRG